MWRGDFDHNISDSSFSSISPLPFLLPFTSSSSSSFHIFFFFFVLYQLAWFNYLDIFVMDLSWLLGYDYLCFM